MNKPWILVSASRDDLIDITQHESREDAFDAMLGNLAFDLGMEKEEIRELAKQHERYYDNEGDWEFTQSTANTETTEYRIFYQNNAGVINPA